MFASDGCKNDDRNLLRRILLEYDWRVLDLHNSSHRNPLNDSLMKCRLIPVDCSLHHPHRSYVISVLRLAVHCQR